MTFGAGPIKRYAAIVICLLAVVAMVTGVYAGIRRATPGMQVKFNKRDFPEHNLSIITPVDPAFEDFAVSYFRGKSDTSFETLKPFSIFVKNSGEKSVVAYALVWQAVRLDGKIRTNTIAYAEPDVLMGNQIPNDPRFKHTQTIEPNAVKCVSWSGSIAATEASLGGTDSSQPPRGQATRDSNTATIRSQLDTDLLQASDITVSLDGVFFDDGTFVGPNVSGFFERIQAMVNAKLDLYREITIASEQGTVDQAFDAIAAKSLSSDVKINSTSTPDDYYQYYSKLFAGEISGMKRAYGKKGLVAHIVNSKNRAPWLSRK